MIRIAITIATFEAIAATLPLGSAGYEAEAISCSAAEIRSYVANPGQMLVFPPSVC